MVTLAHTGSGDKELRLSRIAADAAGNMHKCYADNLVAIEKAESPLTAVLG